MEQRVAGVGDAVLGPAEGAVEAFGAGAGPGVEGGAVVSGGAQVVAAAGQQGAADAAALRCGVDVEHLDEAALRLGGDEAEDPAVLLPDPDQALVDAVAADLDEDLVGIVLGVLVHRVADLEQPVEVRAPGLAEGGLRAFGRHGRGSPASISRVSLTLAQVLPRWARRIRARAALSRAVRAPRICSCSSIALCHLALFRFDW